jgi:hypothetical protein
MSNKRCQNCWNGELGSCGCDAPEGYSTTSIICPYCGHENDPFTSEGSAYDENAEKYDCEECEKTFCLDVSISYSWTTTHQEET